MVISFIFDHLFGENLMKFQTDCGFLVEKLKEIQDFYLEIKWEFSSKFIPFLSHFTPSGKI